MNIRRVSPLFAALVAPILLYGCTGGAAAPGPKPPHQRLFVILLDATASFVSEWPQAVEQAANGIKELNPGDKVVAIAITDRGWQSRDILIPFSTISPVTLRAFHDRSELAKRVRALRQPDWTSGHMVNGHPVGRPLGTDLAGATDYADFLTQQAANSAVTVAIFSDFEDDAPKGFSTARKNREPWPLWTHIIAMHIRADKQGGTITQQRIDRWCDLFNSMRSNPEPVCMPSDFHLIGTENAVSSFFAWTRR